MGLVFLLGGSAWFLSCFPAAVQQKARTAALRHGSQETTAVVTGLRRTGHGDRLVSYAFTAHGAALAGECAVPWEHWRGLREAGPLPIRFLPSNPAINHPAAWEGPDSDMWWVACVLSAFIAATGIWGAVIPLRRDRELVAKGAAAAGVILKCFQGGRGGWVANYQFRTEDGTTAQGTSPCPNRLEIGSTVCVLYLPQAPRRNQPYCFQTAEGLKTSNLSYCVAV